MRATTSGKSCRPLARSVGSPTNRVDAQTLDRCLQAATWAPNGANAQLWRFIVIIAGHLVVGWPRGRHGPLRRRPVSDVIFHNTWDTEHADIVHGRGTRPTRG